jgi:hypothetical protein
VGKLHQLGKIVIRIYANDHLPPHFHVIAPDFETLIEIETMLILRGDLPSAHRKAVLSWVHEHRQAIVAEWNRINARFPITR